MAILLTRKVIVYKGALGDMAAEWMTEEDWKEHMAYVEKLKADGEYLKPEEHEIGMVYNPMFDGPLENYKNDPSYTVTEM